MVRILLELSGYDFLTTGKPKLGLVCAESLRYEHQNLVYTRVRFKPQ